MPDLASVTRVSLSLQSCAGRGRTRLRLFRDRQCVGTRTVVLARRGMALESGHTQDMGQGFSEGISGAGSQTMTGHRNLWSRLCQRKGGRLDGGAVAGGSSDLTGYRALGASVSGSSSKAARMQGVNTHGACAMESSAHVPTWEALTDAAPRPSEMCRWTLSPAAQGL